MTEVGVLHENARRFRRKLISLMSIWANYNLKLLMICWHTAKDLGQSPIQSAQFLKACGLDNTLFTASFFVLKSNPYILCTY